MDNNDLIKCVFILIYICIFSQRKSLQVSLFQALCLLLFNEGDVFSFTDIMTATGIGKLYTLLSRNRFHYIMIGCPYNPYDVTCLLKKSNINHVYELILFYLLMKAIGCCDFLDFAYGIVLVLFYELSFDYCPF